MCETSNQSYLHQLTHRVVLDAGGQKTMKTSRQISEASKLEDSKPSRRRIKPLGTDLMFASLVVILIQILLDAGFTSAWGQTPSYNYRRKIDATRNQNWPSTNAQNLKDESHSDKLSFMADSSPAFRANQKRGHEQGLLADEDLIDTSSSAGVRAGSNEEGLPIEPEDSADSSQENPERNMFLDHHKSQLQAMHDLFERRQLNSPHQLQSSQELNPISIGLDSVQNAPGPPFLPPFQVPNHDVGSMGPLSKPAMASADNLDQGLGPSLPFGLNPLPHLLGFQNQPFDGPQRGDQSAHSNHHALPPSSDSDTSSGQKIWPKIFRFTDGRINLADFEKQKKIRLSNKNQHNSDNHIESAPVIFDGRQLKRKSFLILHGGIFS